MKHIWLLLASLSPAASAVRAQDAAATPDPEVAPPPSGAPPAEQLPEPWWVHVDRLRFDLGFESLYERRVVVTDRRGTFPRYVQLNEQTRFEETLGMSAAGNVFGERVLRYDFDLRWGLRQESFFERRPGPNLDSDPSGDLLRYDFRLDLLPAGRLSASAWGSRSDDRLPRPFLPSLDRDLERYGAVLLWNDPFLPMRLEFEHVDEALRGGFNALDNERFARDTLRYEATWQPDDGHALRFEFEYDDRREEYSGLDTQFDTRRQLFLLDHALRFGDGDRHSLDTLIRYEDESGDLARDAFEFAPRLRLRHSDTLTTTYGAQYLEQRYLDYRLRQWRGDLGLVHQWERLITTLNLFATRQDNEYLGGRGGGFDLTDWGGTLNFAYARENRLGRFSSSLGYTHNHVSASDERAAGIVLTESVTFRDPQLAYLANQNIDPLSLIVSDASRQRVYVSGRDYTVLRVGRFTALRRVPTGRIVDGQTVTVAYRYESFESYDLARDRFDWRLQQDFSGGLGVYYAGSLQDEELDDDRFVRFQARNVNRHRLGALYRRKRWNAGIEYEFNDETIDPFQAVHANGDVLLIDDGRQQLSALARGSRFWFDGSGDLAARQTTLLDAGLTWRYEFSNDLRFSSDAAYRYETDSLFGRTHGVDLNARIEYQLGLFALLFEAEYNVLDLPTSSDGDFAVGLKLRRDFPVIGERR